MCGRQCDQGARCVNGECRGGCDPACSTDQLCCDDTCVDYLTDPENCGDCGNTCLSTETCMNGDCVLTAECVQDGDCLYCEECVDGQCLDCLYQCCANGICAPEDACCPEWQCGFETCCGPDYPVCCSAAETCCYDEYPVCPPAGRNWCCASGDYLCDNEDWCCPEGYVCLGNHECEPELSAIDASGKLTTTKSSLSGSGGRAGR
jgi:hypothetical protein